MRQLLILVLVAIIVGLAGCRQTVRETCADHGGPKTIDDGFVLCRDGYTDTFETDD